jgi:hypothetical protein
VADAPIPLSEQIAECQRELALRNNVYPHFVAKGRMEQSEADQHVARLTAVLNTLLWLEKNEARIKAALRPSA